MFNYCELSPCTCVCSLKHLRSVAPFIAESSTVRTFFYKSVEGFGLFLVLISVCVCVVGMTVLSMPAVWSQISLFSHTVTKQRFVFRAFWFLVSLSGTEIQYVDVRFGLWVDRRARSELIRWSEAESEPSKSRLLQPRHLPIGWPFVGSRRSCGKTHLWGVRQKRAEGQDCDPGHSSASGNYFRSQVWKIRIVISDWYKALKLETPFSKCWITYCYSNDWPIRIKHSTAS